MSAGKQRLIVSHQYPPIPVRDFDWVAYFDEESGPWGTGRTRVIALGDLADQLIEQGRDADARRAMEAA